MIQDTLAGAARGNPSTRTGLVDGIAIQGKRLSEVRARLENICDRMGIGQPPPRVEGPEEPIAEGSMYGELLAQSRTLRMCEALTTHIQDSL